MFSIIITTLKALRSPAGRKTTCLYLSHPHGGCPQSHHGARSSVTPRSPGAWSIQTFPPWEPQALLETDSGDKPRSPAPSSPLCTSASTSIYPKSSFHNPSTKEFRDNSPRPPRGNISSLASTCLFVSFTDQRQLRV